MLRMAVVMVVLLAISSCSESYSDLESAFGVNNVQETQALKTHTIVITSQYHRGAENYNDIADVRLSNKSVDIQIDFPLTKPVSIPVAAVAGCGMTCFGTCDQHVDLLIPRTGTDIMIASSKEVLDWCWNNKKPMFPSSIVRAWEYKGVPLPPLKQFHKQFLSRRVFDEQTKRSCLGY